jgi:hypothetical protein
MVNYLIFILIMRFSVICVAYRPRFGGDSQARTPQLVWTSWRDSAGQELAGKAQLDRDHLYCTRQVLDRKGFLMSVSISSLPT